MRQKRRTFSIMRVNKLEEYPQATMGCVRVFEVQAPNKKQAEVLVDELNAAWLAGESGPIPMQAYEFTFTHVASGRVRIYGIMAQTPELARLAASQLHTEYKEAHWVNK